MNLETFLNKLKLYCTQRTIDHGDYCCQECPLMIPCHSHPIDYTLDMLVKTTEALDKIYVAGM